MLTLDYAVITDAPTTLNSEGDVATSRVQVAKTGKFSDPRYGKFKITLDDFKTWIKNFYAIDRSNGRAGIAIDVDHNPEKGVSTEAAGWVVGLDTTGNELWATVEWNTLGRELVADKRYLYLSPSYQHNYVDEFGKKHGTKLMGVALTNRPFLTMATVTLSESPAFASFEGEVEEAKPPVLDSPPTMPELSTTILNKLGLGAEADEAAVLAAIESRSKPDLGTINLAELAASQGMVILKSDVATQLAADATAGREAARTLHAQRFQTAFDKALSDGRSVPALKESMQALYEKDADTTIALLEASPVIVNTAPRGSSGDGSGGGDVTALEREADGHPIEEGRIDLHTKAEELSRERKIPYTEAVLIAAQGS